MTALENTDAHLHGDIDVAVVGGGIIGTATALYLAREGRRVVVLERGRGPTQASVRNAGGVRAQCRNQVERRLALAAIELWRSLEHETGVDFEHTRAGNLRLAVSQPTLEALAAEQEAEAADGLATELWDRAELRRRAPWLSSRFVGAKHCPTDGHANPILATWMILDAARAAGVSYLQGVAVSAIEADAGRVTAVVAEVDGEPLRVPVGTVVLASGAWTRDLAAPLGVDLPLTPARNAMFVTEPTGPLFDQFVSSHELQVYLRQARAGQIHVGGVFTVDGTFDRTVGVEELVRLATAAEIVPGLRSLRVLRSWAGTLDLTPDHLPLIGTPAAVEGCVVAAGFSGHGFCLGPAVGRTVADLVLGRTPVVDVSALGPDRFAAAPDLR